MTIDPARKAGALDWLSLLVVAALIAATVLLALYLARVVGWTAPVIPLAVAVVTFVVECVLVGVRGDGAAG